MGCKKLNIAEEKRGVLKVVHRRDIELKNKRGNYYPFGMQWDTPNFDFNDNSLEPTGAKTKYTYNGKEFQDDLGINLHYYGFRVYDPAIGRFTSVDPLAEQFAFVSGFNYAENSPISNIDLHGLQKYYAADGSFITQNGDDESMRVVSSGSSTSCATMTCSELETNSVQVHESTAFNKKEAMSNWGTEYQNKGNEHAMALYEGPLTNEDGSQMTAFEESSTVTDGKKKLCKLETSGVSSRRVGTN